MDPHLRIGLAQVAAHPHHGAAGADTGHKGIGAAAVVLKLPLDFRAGAVLMCFDIDGVVELARQVDVLIFFGVVICHLYRTHKPTLRR